MRYQIFQSTIFFTFAVMMRLCVQTVKHDWEKMKNAIQVNMLKIILSHGIAGAGSCHVTRDSTRTVLSLNP
jgi:hypothetical protein